MKHLILCLLCSCGMFDGPRTIYIPDTENKLNSTLYEAAKVFNSIAACKAISFVSRERQYHNTQITYKTLGPGEGGYCTGSGFYSFISIDPDKGSIAHVFLHELGHSWSLGHTPYCGIMYGGKAEDCNRQSLRECAIELLNLIKTQAIVQGIDVCPRETNGSQH